MAGYVSSKMNKIAFKLFNLLGKFLVEFNKCNEDPNGFIYIKHNNGEIIVFGSSVDNVIKNINKIK